MVSDSARCVLDPSSAAELVHELKQAWRGGAIPDTIAALRDHPELLRHRSLVVELAYEEYCLREEAGAAPSCAAFCAALPAFQSQVREVIRGHQLCAEHPELFALPALHWPEPGESFAGLAIVRELGRGSFARVYLALDPETGERPIALKLTTNLSTEAHTLGRLHHPNIGSVFWARQCDGFHAIAMPYLGAATWQDAIDAAFQDRSGTPSCETILDAILTAEQQLPDVAIPRTPHLLTGRESYTTAVARIGTRVAAALTELHHRGIAHGDLKPSNIVLRRGGDPVVIDFNLAAPSTGDLLRCGGTLPYMAPERLAIMLGLKPPGGDTRKADVFALGVILFEALTGHWPWVPIAPHDPSRSASDLLCRQHAAVPTLDSAVPRRFARLVQCCLNVIPEHRPSAAELQRQLERLAQTHTQRWLWRGGVVTVATVGLLGTVLLTSRDRTPLPGKPRESEPARVAAPALPRQPSTVRPSASFEPITAHEFFSRGTERLRQGQIPQARQDFLAALEREKSGIITAHLAYCYQVEGAATVAEPLYRQAIDKQSFAEPWARNNWAYALISLPSPTPGQLQLAIQQCDHALERMPELRAARYNRAVARFLLTQHLAARNTNTELPAASAEVAAAYADIDQVIATGPCDVELFYFAAIIAAQAGADDAANRERVIRLSREAFRRGRSERSLKQDPILRVILQDVEFTSGSQDDPVEPAAKVPNLRLVSPVGD